MLLKRFLAALIALVLLSAPVYAAASRAVVTTGNMTTHTTDLNEELDQLYDVSYHPLDSISGTNTYLASVANMPVLTAYVDGMKFRFEPTVTNTGASTLNIDSVGAKAIVSISGTAMASGDLVAGNVYMLEYLGGADDHFRVMSILRQGSSPPEWLCYALSDETTAITTGNAKLTVNLPAAFTITAVYGYVNTVSSSGTPTFDINEDPDREGGTASATILSTKITIDANERGSNSAATPPVISDAAIAAHAELTFDIDVAGTGAKGAKVCLVGYQ